MKTFDIEVNNYPIHVVVSRDESYFEQQWLDVESNSYEPGIYKIFSDRLTKQTIYVDLGAYIGYTCLYATQLAKQSYAFEPDPIAYEYLKANSLANPHINNMEVLNQAVGMSKGSVRIKSAASGANAGSSLLLTDYKTSWEVEMIDIRDFFRKKMKTDPIFMKVDIEGFEYRLIPAFAELSKQYKITILISLHPQILANTITGRSLFSKLTRRYKMVRAHASLIKLLNSFPYKYKLSGEKYNVSGMLRQIILKGDLKEIDKDILLSPDK